MLIGYARVSKSDDQNTTVQVTALREAGCETIYQEAASGGRWDRPELQRLLEYMRPGDVVIVWKLDRLSRSLVDLLLLLEKMDERGVGFRSVTEAIDTTSLGGRMMMHMLGCFAEFEREMIRERTRAGLERARKEGRVGGRRPKLTVEQQREAVDAVRSGRRTASEMARVFGVHPATISRVVKEATPAETYEQKDT